jgi:hypothetical protein
MLSGNPLSTHHNLIFYIIATQNSHMNSGIVLIGCGTMDVPIVVLFCLVPSHFWTHLQNKCEKNLLASQWVWLSVCRMKQLYSHWKDFVQFSGD